MEEGKERVFQSVDDGQSLISAISRFAVELFQKQGTKSDGNLFMSPFSISTVLNMVYLGARGKTLEEMKSRLFLDALDDSRAHQAFSDVISYLKKHSGGDPASEDDEGAPDPSTFQLYMANRLFGEKSCEIVDEFQTACKKHYDADVDGVSFKEKPEDATEKINNWVAGKTKQKIRNIISPDIIDGDTSLILVNAIYFKSSWQTRFTKTYTEAADFNVSADETIQVPMMFQRISYASYFYSSELACQVLRLPYKSNALSMFVLLPDKASSSLAALEVKLSSEYLVDLDREFKEFPDVDLWLPKFKIEEKLELRTILQDLGMTSLFQKETADLSGICATRKLYASNVVHQAFVDVNEDGTEAAAATAVRVTTYTCGPGAEQPIKFRADHPFVFFIREETTKVVLFLGRVIRPA